MVHYYCTDEYRENHPLFYTLFEDSVVRELKTHDRNIITKSNKEFSSQRKNGNFEREMESKTFLTVGIACQTSRPVPIKTFLQNPFLMFGSIERKVNSLLIVR